MGFPYQHLLLDRVSIARNEHGQRTNPSSQYLFYQRFPGIGLD